MLKKIDISQLRPGMFIHEFCGNWIEHPFWRGRFKLERAEDFEKIRQSSITELRIDTSKGLDVDPTEFDVEGQQEEQPSSKETTKTEVVSASPTREKITKAVTLDEEVQRAAKICAQAKMAVTSMFNDARMGNALALDESVRLVDEISHSVLRHPHALISLSRLKAANEYTYMHSVAVCALMVALARTLGLDDAMVREAGIAGLMHDIGKVLIADSILDKPGKLTDDEFTVIRTHPDKGAGILKNQQHISASVIDVCLHHHEKIDGSGYPDRLAGEQISLLARMGAICDVYDAVTSDRPYKKGWGPAHAIREMASWKGHFDTTLFQAFVKTVGIYPIGALVSLQSGRLGVVVEHNADSLLRPKVKVFLSTRSKLPIPMSVIDLARLMDHDKVLQIEAPEEWGVKNINEIWLGLPA